jgi:hypothetical protein
VTEGFQPPRTIASVLEAISSQQLVLPAIQREFVWNEQKIAALFDSLMRDYPIGGFLYWLVSDETVKEHTFYGFIRDYDQRPPNNFCPRLQEIAPSDSRYAVLDGQQLTSLNIGLRGERGPLRFDPAIAMRVEEPVLAGAPTYRPSLPRSSKRRTSRQQAPRRHPFS